MNGFMIEYVDENGLENRTWFGEPITNVNEMSKDACYGLVVLIFSLSYPESEITGIMSCTMDEYKKRLS